MDGTIRFSASNIPNRALEGTFNGIGRRPWVVMLNLRNFRVEFLTFLMIGREPRELRGNGWYGWIQRIKWDQWYSGENFWWLWEASMGGNIIFTQFYSAIFDVFDDRRGTKRDMGKRMVPLDSAGRIGLEIILKWFFIAVGGCSLATDACCPTLNGDGGVF